MVAPRDDLDVQTVKAVLAGHEDAYGTMRSAYGYGGLVIAVASPRRGALYPDEAAAPQDDALGRVGAVIEFFSVRDWQQIRFGLQWVEDLRDFEVVARSARAAEVVFDFDGSVDQ